MSKVLLDDVRHATARRLLEATDLQEGGIAFLLGFEERTPSPARSATGRV